MNKINKKFSAGSISATIWNNEKKDSDGKIMEFKTISIDRRYQDKDGNWKSTSSMRINDLPKVVMVSQKAFEYINLKEEESE